jgi:N-acyl homoserine lactone hydrolase
MPLTEAGDVILVGTPGHTPGHMSVAVEPPSGPRILLAGDASYLQDLMLSGRIDGVSPNPAQARTTVERLQRLVADEPTVFLPTHDPDADRRLAELEPARESRPHR